jgi:hypothetical protein
LPGTFATWWYRQAAAVTASLSPCADMDSYKHALEANDQHETNALFFASFTFTLQCTFDLLQFGIKRAFQLITNLLLFFF